MLYADDLVLCSESTEGLQKQLNGLSKFFKRWHLLVNLIKTKILVFNKKQIKSKFYYNKNEVEVTTHYKYLGVWFNTVKFDYLATTSEYLVEQANKALFQAYKLSSPTVGRLSPTIALKMFDLEIMPILEYGSEVWGSGKVANQFENFHIKFLKSTLSVIMQAPTNAIYAETGRMPLSIKFKVKAIKYWVRILEMPINCPVKCTYQTLMELDNFGQQNWCTNIRKLLYNLDYMQYWVDQKV